DGNSNGHQDGEPQKGACATWGAAPGGFQVQRFTLQAGRGGLLLVRVGVVHGLFLHGVISRILNVGTGAAAPFTVRRTAGEAVPVWAGTGVRPKGSLWMASTWLPRRRCQRGEVRCSTIVRSSAM